MTYFTDLFNRAEKQYQDILLVVSGWDGLTTNQGAFQKLFALRPEKINVRLRILSVDLDRWRGKIPHPVSTTSVHSRYGIIGYLGGRP